MKIKRMLAAPIALILMLALGGCQLAIPERESDSPDRLIGMLITTNKSSLPTDEEGRVYARLTSEEAENDDGELIKYETYVFDGIDVWYILCPTIEAEEGEPCTGMSGNDGIDDRHVEFAFGDNVDSIKMTGTLRAACGSGENALTFVGNPIYQSADGSVYAILDAMGMMMSEGIGSLKLSESETADYTGKKAERSTEIVVDIKLISPTEKVRIYDMDESGMCLLQKEYTGETMPDEYSPSENAEFIVVEALLRDGGHSYFAYGRSDESFVSYFCGGSDICTSFETAINW